MTRTGKWLIDTLRSRLLSALSFCRKIGAELLTCCMLAIQQLVRLGKFAWAAMLLPVRRRTLRNANRALGEYAAAMGLGDPLLRASLDGFPDAGSRSQRMQRNAVIQLLAADVLAEPHIVNDKPLVANAEHAQRALANAELDYRGQRQALLSGNAADSARAAFGAALVVILFWQVSGSRPATEDPTDGSVMKTSISAAAEHFVAEDPARHRDRSTAVNDASPVTTANAFVSTADEVVSIVTQPRSNTYLDAGFKGFHFGTPAATIVELSKANKDNDRIERFFVENDRLVGYQRVYTGDNKTYLAQFRELFGGADSDDVTETEGFETGATIDRVGNSVGTANRNQSLLVRYYFPRSLAYVHASWNSSAQGNVIGIRRNEALVFNIFDRSWADAQLAKHGEECKASLEWVRAIMKALGNGDVALISVPEFHSTKRDQQPPANEGILQTTRFIGKDNKVFVGITRSLKDSHQRPKGTIEIGLHLDVDPEVENPVVKYRYLAMEADRCDAIIAQDVFRPRSKTIQTERKKNSHQKSFVWWTNDDWKVTVSPGGHIYFSNAPEKRL